MLPSQQPRNHQWKPKQHWFNCPKLERLGWSLCLIVAVGVLYWVWGQ